MKKTITILLLAAVLLSGACSKKKGGGAKLKTDTDSVAYIIGMNVGLNLLKMDSTLNVSAVCDGIRDVFRDNTALTVEEAQAFYLRYMNYTLPEKAIAYEEQFLADIAKSNRAYARTQSGVTYTVEELGDQNAVPSANRDSVILRYAIRTADGAELYSSFERGDSLYTTLGNLPLGVQESLKLIGKGGRISAWLPSKLAYGAGGDAELGVEPNAVLFYDIQLLELDKQANRAMRK